MVESGGLENRCTRKGTVGSNPTLSAMLCQLGYASLIMPAGTKPNAYQINLQDADIKHRTALALGNDLLPQRWERSPNWYGTALEARRAERPVRVRVPLSPPV